MTSRPTRSKARPCLRAFLLALACSGAPVAAAAPDAGQDVEQLCAYHEQLKNEIVKDLGQRFVNDSDFVAKYAGLLERIERFEQHEQPQIESFLAAFVERYTDNRNDIGKRLEEAGWARQGGLVPGTVFVNLKSMLAQANETRDDVYDTLVTHAERSWKIFGERTEFAISDKAWNDVIGALDVAMKYRPDRPEAPQARERILTEKDAVDAKRAGEVAQRPWPGHVAAFAGPGEPGELAAVAMEWFHAKGDRPLAIAIRANWSPHERTATGLPITYALPLYVAYQSKEKPKEAVVVRMSLITIGAEMAPKWVGTSVGDSFRMLIENIPADVREEQGGDVEGAVGASPSSRGLIDLGVNVILAMLTMGGGLLLAAPALTPGIARAAQRAQPLLPVLGAVLLASGLLSAMLSMLRLAPFDHLLLQGGALLVAAILLRSVIEARAGAPRIRASLDRIARAAQPVGFAAAAFGFAHLVLGGCPLM